MKTLRKLKLNVLSDIDLLDREMNSLRGGGPFDSPCSCSCYYEGQSGGASTADNAETNAKTGYSSSNGCNQYTFTPGGAGWSYCDTCTA